jgi:hypothetical protein
MGDFIEMKKEIYEASLDDDILKKVRADTTIKLAYGDSMTKLSSMTLPLFDMEKVWGLMNGAIDNHVHGAPDAYDKRLYDEFELAIQACQAGMKAIVFKCASGPSARSAYIVKNAVNRWAEEHQKRKIDVFGGVCLNYCVGGLNPEAVYTSYRAGGKVVWLPNRDASFHRKVVGTPGGIDVVDENDEILPSLREIFSMIAEGDMVLSLTHQSTKERFILIEEAKKMGIKRIEVCHPNQVTAKMTVEQMKMAADKGAYIGYYCTRFRPLQWSWNEFMHVYKAVGPDRIIASTDLGHFESLSPVEGMRVYITGMLVRGIPEKDVEKMVKHNPTMLLY